jgi:photosystem II stability/assembly factor-like uncharacterized protein
MDSNAGPVISFTRVGCLATALLALPVSAGINTWTAIGPAGVENSSGIPFAVDPSSPDTIYVATGNTVMKTTDGGQHWVDMASRFAVDPINVLVIDPTASATIYAAGGTPWDYGGFSIYKSSDGGAHWISGSTDRPTSVLTVAPSRSSTLYAGENDVVVKSIDGGLSWTPRGTGLTGFYVSALAIDSTNADVTYLAQQVVGRPDTGEIFKSTDGGLLWGQLPIPVPAGSVITSLAIDPVTPSTVYAAYAYGYPGNGGVFKSIDSGATWVAAQDGLSDAKRVMALAIDPSRPARIFAATHNGVFMSTDAAASWTPINSGLPSPAVWAISIDRTGSILRTASDTSLFEYRFSGSSSTTSVPLIEYFHAQFDHYFITSNPDEIDKLDSGIFAGWARTGFQFNAYGTPNANSLPVCRFFSTAFAPKSSHFYTLFATECASRRADPAWMLESADAFDIAAPASDGSCATGLTPVYRLYNNGQGGAPNHRYTTDATVRAQMIAQGWVPEGLGSNGVEMCSPP